LSGGLVSFAFPPYPWTFLAWFAMVPFLASIARDAARPLSVESSVESHRPDWTGSFGPGLVFGFAYHAGLLSWWMQMFLARKEGLAVAAATAFAICAYGAVFTGLFSLIFALGIRGLARRPHSVLSALAPFWAAAVWVFIEFAACRSVGGLAWSTVGNSLWNSPAYIQTGSLFGPWGLSFLVVLANASIALAFAGLPGRRAALLILPSLLLIVSAGLLGRAALRRAPGEAGRPAIVRVAALHGHFDPEKVLESDFGASKTGIFERLAGELRGGPDLAVWPQLAVLDFSVPAVEKRVTGLAAAGRVPHIVGVQEEDGTGRVFNSAVLVSSGGLVESVYRKMRPVPFAETPLFGHPTIDDADTFPGDSPVLLKVAGANGRVAVAPTICWEMGFPGMVRDLTKMGGQVIVNLSEGIWFNPKAQAQYFALGLFRAAENRRWVVVSAANGISGAIDPWGRVVREVRPGTSEILYAGVTPRSDLTWYVRMGDVLPWPCLVFGFLGFYVFRRKTP